MSRALRELLVRRTGAFREIFRYLNLTSSANAKASPRPKPRNCTKGRQKTAQQHKATSPRTCCSGKECDQNKIGDADSDFEQDHTIRRECDPKDSISRANSMRGWVNSLD